MRLVGERHEKSALVELVNWLLVRLDAKNPQYATVKDAVAAAYAAYDSDPRVNGPDGYEAFGDAVKRHCYNKPERKTDGL